MSVTVSPIEYTVTIVDQLGGTVVVSPTTQTVSIASPGPQGAAGAAGATGATGATGAKGDKGDTGNTGATGAGVAVGGTAGQVLAKIDATNYNTQWITPATPGTATTAGVYGVTTLTDSTNSTSTTTAATPASVKSSYDVATAGWEAFNFGTAGVIATVPRFMLTAVASPVSGSIIHSKIVSHRDFVVTNIAFASSTVAAIGATLIRFGIYTRSGTTFTLVARTASDTTIFNTASTKFTRALDTTGGYPATYTMIAGTEYFLSVIQVATTAATLLLATTRAVSAANAATGAQYYTDAGETDLVTSSTGSVSTTLGGLYAEVS